MSLITLLIALLVIGALLTILAMLPIEAKAKLALQVIAIVAVVIWLLQRVGPALRL